MPVRSEMAGIIAELRQYGQAAPDDEFDGVTYWTDQQLQDIADRNSTRGIIKLQRVSPDNLIYKIVAPLSVRFEDSLVAYDGETAIATASTYNPFTNELTFDDALSEDTYNVYGNAVQIYDALAQLWEAKAGQRYNYIDWKAQNNKMNMQQEYQHCVDMARYYRNKRIRSFDRRGKGRWSRV